MAQQVDKIVQQRKSEGRGKILTVLLAFEGLLLFSEIPYMLHILTGMRQPHLYDTYNLALFFVMTGLCIGIWKWSKIAAFTFIIIYFAEGCIGTVFLYYQYKEMLVAFLSLTYILIISGLWIWAIKRKWHLFT